MNAPNPNVPAPRSVTRQELEAVIRRAAEIYAAEADAKENLSEEELLQVAAELGLPARYVRQALYELPVEEKPQPWLLSRLIDRLYGPTYVVVNRALPREPQRTFSALEDYLCTQEYLKLRRKQGTRAVFEPADDAISTVARAFGRLKRRYYLVDAKTTDLSVQGLEPGWSHVHLAMDLSGVRRRASWGGAAVGGVVGAFVGYGAAFLAAIAAPDLLGGSLVPEIGAFIAGFTGSVATGFAAMRGRFRRHAAETRTEAEALLDRLERGESLAPPPPPWQRRLTSSMHPPHASR